jgi:hypothetical protein
MSVHSLPPSGGRPAPRGPVAPLAAALAALALLLAPGAWAAARHAPRLLRMAVRHLPPGRPSSVTVSFDLGRRLVRYERLSPSALRRGVLLVAVPAGLRPGTYTVVAAFQYHSGEFFTREERFHLG